jgi:uncharacterized OB-fold protein
MPVDGVIAESTALSVPLPGIDAPYVVGFVELANGVTVYSRIAADPDAPPAAGTPARVVADGQGGWLTEVAG